MMNVIVLEVSQVRRPFVLTSGDIEPIDLKPFHRGHKPYSVGAR